jgi:DNA-binding IclR family transcriptional regulator
MQLIRLFRDLKGTWSWLTVMNLKILMNAIYSLTRPPAIVIEFHNSELLVIKFHYAEYLTRSMADKDHIKSIEKCFAILDCLHARQSLMTLEEITQAAGLKKTTCFRLLKTLRTLGIIELSPATKKYQYAPRLAAIGLAALKNMNLRQAALPILRQLRDETGETVNLTILSGSDILYVERVMSDYLVNVNVNIGDRLPVYCASMGKVILAYLPQDRLEAILSSVSFKPKTDNTIVSRSALVNELEQIRNNGYAINDEELEKGLRAVAAPIFNYTGEAFAATNIAWTTARHPQRATFSEFADKIVAAAKRISRLMGYAPVE